MPRIPRSFYRELLPFSALVLAALVVLSLTSSGWLTGSLAAGGPRESAHVNSAPVAPDSAEAGEAYGRLPLSFVENVGQADRGVKFLARGAGYGLFLTPTEAVLALQKPSAKDGAPATVRMKLLRSNEAPRVSGSDELPGKNNYFVGDDPSKWRTGVPTYARVQFGGVYPGVDLVYYGNQRQLEYDFVVAPGSDPRTIGLGFEGVDRVEVDAAGELVLHTAGGEVRQRKPFAYQETENGARQEVAARYVLKGAREVGFEVGEYDAERTLVIDPILVYSTYLGGINTDNGYSIAVNAAGQAFVTGSTASDNFPVSAAAAQKKRAFYPTPAGALYTDAFVTKLNGAGTAVVYSTFLGGNLGREIGKGIAVDSLGNAYVTGVTGGGVALSKGTNDFPVVNAHQPAFGGTDDAFVVKLNPTGSALLYSTYLGGNSTDYGERIAVNAATGEAYITGGANPATFPTTPGAYKPASGCTNCINDVAYSYVAKFAASGALDWSTLVGQGAAYDIAIDAAGNSYITGIAASNLFPVTPGAFQTTNGVSDAFVTKLNPFGTELVYSTFLGGGPQSDRGFGIAVDLEGNAYVTGQTENAAFPVTPGAFDVTYNGGSDVFITKLNADASGLVYSTFIGGGLQDLARAIALDKAGNAYITGQTKSYNYPLKNSIQPKTLGTEVFLTKLNAAGSAIAFSTYLGTGDGRDIVYNETYGAYLTGHATQIPVTTNAFQTMRNRGPEPTSYHDAFVMRIRSANEATAVKSIGGKITDTTSSGFPSPGLVTMTLSGAQNRTTNLTSTNTYSFGGLPTGTYTVTPSKVGFRFEPASRTFTSITANQVADFAVLPNAAPAVDITSPASGENFIAPATITITADATDSDGSVTEVQFYANSMSGKSVVIGTDTTAPYSVTWSNVAGGSYVIGATAKDDLGMKGGNIGVVSITVGNNVPATVELTSPAAGSTYKTGEFVAVNANVTASGETPVSYVDFFAGTEHVARDWSAPYGFNWRPLTAGTFALTARAIDQGGAVGTSPPVSVTVNDALSTFQGTVLEGSTPLSGVTVTLTGAQTATVTTGADGKFAFPNLQAEAGYTVTPTKAGYTFEPASLSTDFMGYYDRTETFRAVRNSSVSVVLTTPGFMWRYTAPAEVSMTADASSTAGVITKVEFYANSPSGRTFIGADTTAPYSFVWSNVPAGDYGIQAVATDSTGDSKGSDSSLIMVEAPPSVVRINGQLTDGSGTGMSGLRVTLSGTVNATAVTNLMGYYTFGSVPKGGNYTITAPAAYTWTPAASRTFTNLTVDQLDVDFETASFNSAPVVTLTSPAANASYTSPATVALSATASDKDGTVTRVQFYRRTPTASHTLGTDTVAPYGFNWAVSTPGTYEIVAVATDNGGLRTTSAPITITIKAATTTAQAIGGELSQSANDSLASLLVQPSLFPAVLDAAGRVRVGQAYPSRAALAPFFGLASAALGNLT